MFNTKDIYRIKNNITETKDIIKPTRKAIIFAEKYNIEIEELATVKPLVPQDNSPAETLVLALTHSNQTYAVSYGTEGGIIQTDAEVPTVVCGPGSIAEAHKPDEFIALSEIKACETFVTRLIKYCTSR